MKDEGYSFHTDELTGTTTLISIVSDRKTLIEDFIARFKKLNVNRNPAQWTPLTTHCAPHKPLLLLAVMDLFAEGAITANCIEPSTELIELFALYWSRVTRPQQRSSIIYPFFHLSGDRFWHLEAQPGKDSVLVATRQIRSMAHLQEIVWYARLDEELYALFNVETTRNLLRAALIETYFAAEIQPALIDQGSINVEAFHYSCELLEQARNQRIQEGTEEDRDYRPAVRDQAFRRAVVLAYNHRCAICGLRMVTSDGHTVVDAAHIEPWSVSHNDDPRNGMALCRLCHWSFDEGLVSVSEHYHVLTSRQISINQNFPGHLLTLTGRPIVAPEDRLLWPGQNFLAYHRLKLFRPR
jgi:putative restriction endonuclease